MDDGREGREGEDLSTSQESLSLFLQFRRIFFSIYLLDHEQSRQHDLEGRVWITSGHAAQDLLEPVHIDERNHQRQFSYRGLHTDVSQKVDQPLLVVVVGVFC